MPIKFMPTGMLDVQSEPLRLPSQMDGKTEISGAMVRCTNLDLIDAGKAVTRNGISRVSSNPVGLDASLILVISSDIYVFCSDQIYLNEVSINSSSAANNWRGVISKAFNATDDSIFCSDGGINQLRITGSTVAKWGISAPESAPLVTTAGSDGKTYQIRYTYCRFNGAVLECESNPSPVATSDNHEFNIGWVVPSDSQVTHVRIYRSLGDYIPTYLAGTEAIATLSVVVVVDDTALGALVEEDHDCPPAGMTILGPVYNNTLFMLVGEKLYWSKPNQPEYWPTDYWLQVSSKGFRLRAGAFYDNVLYVASKEDIYMIQGTGTSSFFSLPTGTNIGAISDMTFIAVKGHGIYHMASDGIYLFSQGTDTRLTGGIFDPIFNGDTVGSIPGMNWDLLGYSWMVVYRGQLWFGYGKVGGSMASTYYPANFLVLDLKTGRTKHYSYPVYFNNVTFQSVYDRLIVISSNGNVYMLEDYTRTEDDGVALDAASTVITWDIQTKDFGMMRKYFPRWSRYDVALLGDTTATATILVDGVVKQTHAITSSRNTRKRLIATCAGDRLSIRVTGTGPAEIISMEME
jgi:hypothetical protein